MGPAACSVGGSAARSAWENSAEENGAWRSEVNAGIQIIDALSLDHKTVPCWIIAQTLVIIKSWAAFS